MIRPLRLFLAALIVAGAAAARPAVGAISERSICPISEVRAGQRAVAKSVFQGTEVESFHLEILGVLRKFDGTRDVILGRILDGPVVERESGVVGGMSGSPVYIGGRLAGAIALTWPWSKEPIAGITPIEEMLEAWGEPRAEVESGGGSPSPGVRVGDATIKRVRVAPSPPSAPDPPGVMTLVPLGGVVQAAGFSGRSVERVSEVLAPYGLRVAAGPAGAEVDLRPPLVPGAALGAKLMSGDFDMTAIGTVTLVEGDRVLGFGHPLFQRGELDLPMTGGYVHDVLPSLHVSNKLMSPTQTVGRIFRDHQSAVAGAVGPAAEMLPLTIEVSDEALGRAREFGVEIAKLRELMPGLVGAALMTAVDETRGRIAKGSVQLSVEVKPEGRPAVRREEAAYSPVDAALVAIPAVLKGLVLCTENRFGEMDLERVRVRVHTADVRKTASIERVTVSQSRVEAGDTVTLRVTVRPYGEEPVQVPMELALPADLPQGPVRIAVSAGDAADQARTAIGAARPAPVTLDQLLERYEEQDRSNELVVQAALTRRGLSLLGEELPGAPAGAIEALKAAHPTDLRQMPSVVRVVHPTEWVLSGTQMVGLMVESPLAKAPPGRPPEPPEQGPKQGAIGRGFFRSRTALVRAAGAEGAARLAAGAVPPGKEDGKEEKAEPLARAPELWAHSSASDYAEATLRSVDVSERGALSLAAAAEPLASLPADAIWSIAVREGSVYVGAGCDGVVYRVSPEGEVEVLFETGEMNVHALAFDGEGDLYAGTSPRGRLFRIASDGEGKLVCDTESAYLWSLLVSADGTIYAAGGYPARIYAVEPGGRVEVAAELSVANILSLVRTEDGDLYAGSADGGVVYHIPPGGEPRAVCQVSGSQVSALALGEDGSVYAASSPGGQIYRIPPEGIPEVYCETGERTIHGLALLGGGELIAATGTSGLLIRADREGDAHVVFRPETGIATAVTAVDGTTYAAWSGPCVLRTLGSGSAEWGVVESGPLDAGRAARWGRVECAAELPSGTSVEIETRSGDSPDPDDHWSGWRGTVDGAIASPPGRYLQYRLTLKAENPEVTPVVRQVRISHRPQNQRPTCGLKEPSAGDWLSKKQTLKWQARDPDKDTLSYQVAVSSDLGQTWDELAGDLREAEHEWNTEEQEDGRYLLRVKATDRLSVPEDAQTAEATAFVWVDNTPPTLLLFGRSLRVDEERRAHLTGMASDSVSPIRSIEYRVGDEEWSSLPVAAVETSVTDLAVHSEQLEAGEHALEVRAFDAAGNHASKSVTVSVEAAVEVEEGTKGEETPAAPSAAEEGEAGEATEAGVEEPVSAEARANGS